MISAAYPIPAPRPDYGQALRLVSAQGGAITDVLNSMGEIAGQQFSNQAANLQAVTSTLSRSAKGNLTYQQKQLNQVLHPVALSAINSVQEQAAQLGMVASPVPVADQPVQENTWCLVSSPDRTHILIIDKSDPAQAANLASVLNLGWILWGCFATEQDAIDAKPAVTPINILPTPDQPNQPPNILFPGQPVPMPGGIFVPGMPGQPPVFVPPGQPVPNVPPANVINPQFPITPPSPITGQPIPIVIPGQPIMVIGPSAPPTSPIVVTPITSPVQPPPAQQPPTTIVVTPIGQPPINPIVTTQPIIGEPPITYQPPISEPPVSCPPAPPCPTVPVDVTTPVEPEPPPIDTFSTLTVLPSEVVPDDDWCKLFFELRDITADYGGKIIITVSAGRTDIIDPRSFLSGLQPLFAYAWRDFEDDNGRTRMVDAIANERNLFDVSKSWIDLSRGLIGTDDTGKLAGLRAVKCYLEMMAAWRVVVTGGGDHKYSNSLSSGVELFKVGTHGERVNTHANSASEEIAVKPYILPVVDLVDLFIGATEQLVVPSIPEAIESYIRGEYSQSKLECIVRLNGGRWPEWLPVVRARRDRLDYHQLVEYGRRNNWSVDDIDNALSKRGMTDASDRSAFLTLYDELPNVADHMHWLQRNVFDDQYVQDYKLLEGFEERFWSKYGSQLLAQGYTKERASQQYAAHWILPSPGQLAEMVQRLRPGRAGMDEVVTEDDYIRLLAEQDVAPWFRERFLAISKVRMAKTFFTDLYLNGVENVNQLYNRYLDLGYSEDDADALTKNESLVRIRKRTAQVHGYTPAILSRLFALDLIDADTVQARMNEQGYTDEESQELQEVSKQNFQYSIVRRAASQSLARTMRAMQDSYQAGAIDRQTAQTTMERVGFTEAFASSTLDALDITRKTDLIKKSTAAVHKATLRGELDIAGAAAVLTQLGITQQRITELTDLWSLELETGKKQLAVSQITRLVSKGMLDLATAAQRLRNLNWSDIDGTLLLAEAEARLAETEAKALAAAERNREKQAAALQKVLKENQTQKERIQKDLCRTIPASRLQNWYAEHIIGEDYFRNSLTSCGYTQEVIDDYFLEAELKREKYDSKPHP